MNKKSPPFRIRYLRRANNQLAFLMKQAALEHIRTDIYHPGTKGEGGTTKFCRMLLTEPKTHTNKITTHTP